MARMATVAMGRRFLLKVRRRSVPYPRTPLMRRNALNASEQLRTKLRPTRPPSSMPVSLVVQQKTRRLRSITASSR